jgi:hypothetical protein
MKTNVLLTITCFTAGIVTGWFIADSKTKQAQHIDTEYYIELKSDDSAIIEGLDGHTYVCPINDIPVVLIKDNL